MFSFGIKDIIDILIVHRNGQLADKDGNGKGN